MEKTVQHNKPKKTNNTKKPKQGFLLRQPLLTSLWRFFGQFSVIRRNEKALRTIGFVRFSITATNEKLTRKLAKSRLTEIT